MANEQVADLRQALLNFQSDVSSLNQFKAVQQANEAVQGIRASAENDAKKRAALQQIANTLVGQLALHGTPASTMQIVAGAIAPQLPANPEAAAIQASTQGNDELLQNIVAGDRAIREPREEAQLQRDIIRANATARAQEGKTQREAEKLPVSTRKEIDGAFDLLDRSANLEKEIEKLSLLERQGIKAGSARFNGQLARLKTLADVFQLTVTKSYAQGSISDFERRMFSDIVGGIQDFKSTEAIKGSYQAFKEGAMGQIENRLKTQEDLGSVKTVGAIRQRLAKYGPVQDRMAASAAGGPRIIQKMVGGRMRKIQLDPTNPKRGRFVD